MVEANVKIMEDLQHYLSICCEDAVIRSRFTTGAGAFSRTRKLPMQRVALLILNFLKRSLNVEIKDFFERALNDTGISCSKGAFCLQRLKLKPSFFFVWNQLLVSGFYEHYGAAVKRWNGLRLWAADGSMVYLLNTASLRSHFGVQRNKHGERVMARALQIEDVLNGVTVYGNLFSMSTSEQSVMYQLAESLPPDALLLLDRNFASYALMYLLIHQEQSRHFVIRCKTGASFKEVACFMRSRQTSRVVTIHPSSSSIQILYGLGYRVTSKTGLTIRMVKIKLPNGETEVLLTNLLDGGQYSTKEIGKLYGLRWKIEIKFYKQKHLLRMEEFSGHSVCAVCQDYLANVLVSNLHSLIEKQCQVHITLLSEKRTYVYRINYSASLAAMKHTIVHLWTRPVETVLTLLSLQRLFEAHVEPERAGRFFPRIRRHNRRNGRVQTFTNYRRNI